MEKTDKLLIRAAETADNPHIRNIVQASLADFGLAVEFDGLDAAIGSAGLATSQNVIELVALYDGKLCACLAIQEMAGRQGKLFGFHVDHRYRGKGVGRALLQSAMLEAKKRGYVRLCLDTWDTMQYAIRLYETMGWVATTDPSPESGANRSYVLQLR